MTIEHNGQTFQVFVAPIASWYANEPKAKHPLYILGCQRCGTSCSTVPGGSCHCCKRYKTRTNGGTLNFPTLSGKDGLFNYDPNALKHVRIARFEDVVKL